MEQKSIILALDEAKIELVQSINNIIRKYGLSCYLVEPFFDDIYSDIKRIAQDELSQAKKERADELARMQKIKNEAEKSASNTKEG